MVKPGPDDSEPVSLSDDYIRQLQPDDHRYDITLAPDFVISVLPNGIKTWAFIYDFQGRSRRRTLGVYPDMSFAEAKKAVQKSRQAISRMDEPTEPPHDLGSRPAVLGGGVYIPKQPTSKPKWFLRSVSLVLVLLAIGLAVFFFLQNDGTEPSDRDTGFSLENARSPTPAATPPQTPAPSRPGRLPFDVAPEKPADTAPEPASAPPQTSMTRPAAAITPTAAPPSTTGSAIRNGNVSPRQRTEAPNSNNRAEPDASLRATISTAAQNNAARPPGEPAENNVNPEPVNNRRVTLAQTEPESIPAAQPSSTVDRAGAAAARRSGARVTALPDGVTALGGSVPRSVLTSRVQNLEPTDVLGPDISQRSSGFTRVFYFTELREFSDGKVLHRWERNGQVTDEVLLKVQKSWRWRTYSNKDLTPGLTGQWRVSTIDAAGNVLDTEEFTFGRE